MNKGAVLLVSYHFYPSREVGAKRPSETALYLSKLGYDVTVLRARERQLNVDQLPAEFSDVRIISVNAPRKLITAAWIRLKRLLTAGRKVDRTNSGSRSTTTEVATKLSPFGWARRQLLALDTLFQSNKLWLLISVAKIWMHARRQRFDLVIASGPPMVSYICGWAASHIGSPRLILDYRDPWYLHGDKELTTAILGHPLANFENRLAKKCAERCDALIAASPGTKKHILERFGVPDEKVHVVRNGFDAHARVDVAPPRGILEILYTGSLYWNRNPFPFLEALHGLVSTDAIQRDRVRVRLVGNCDMWKDVPLAPWIDDRNMQDVVEILPFVASAELRLVVASSNVLINFAQGQPRQIPAKSYDYIASGRDVIVIAEDDSDVADLFREAGVGRTVVPGDSEGFVTVIQDLYRKHVIAVRGAEEPLVDIERYSRATQLANFSTIVADVLDVARRIETSG